MGEMINYQSRYKKSGFYHIRKILNSYKLNETFTRKEALKRIKSLNVTIFNFNFDNHYRMLKKLGYIENVSKGKYKLLKVIPGIGINVLIKRNKKK